MKQRNYGGRKPIDSKALKNEALRIRLSKKQLEEISRFHQCTNYKNISTLIRKVLFQQSINVQLKNVELLTLIITLDKIRESCDGFLRTKRENTQDLKSVMLGLKMEIISLQERIKKLEFANLALDELAQAKDWQIESKNKWWFYDDLDSDF